MRFELHAPYKPAGDQPQAIEQLIAGLRAGEKHQTLLGVTGSGKTYTVANVIAKVQKPTLVIAHNKTLAAQLTQEFRTFFPKNAVEYFVSYYDYYQPEAYLPSTDTYIEKETQINEEIDRLRHAATAAILSRRDVIIVATVSCIYGLGSPEAYKEILLEFSIGAPLRREELLERLIAMYYTRTDVLKRGTFRVRGEVFEIMRPDREYVVRIELSGNRITSIGVYDALTRALLEEPKQMFLFPAKHFVVPGGVMEQALGAIREELRLRLEQFKSEDKLLEAERLERRTRYDLELMKEVGYCNGIENYSRYLSGRNPGEPPDTLVDYFIASYGKSGALEAKLLNPEAKLLGPRVVERSLASAPSIRSVASVAGSWLLVIDESHVTVPQIRGMYEGDRSRKQTLVDHGFRLPSALDNRPLKFMEFEARIPQVIYISATPGMYEKKYSSQTVEQIVRPTGLVDPEVAIKPSTAQIADVIKEIEVVKERGERVLVTTLTKKMAEDLQEYLEQRGVKAKYLHSDVETLDRIRLLEGLRRGEFDVLVGVNLLREGLDLPEVSLVAILDADQEGFLRSDTSLIQTMGRAARNVRGRVILYAEEITDSMKRALAETDRRRTKQLQYNKEHGITPKSIQKAIASIVDYELKTDVPDTLVELEKIEDIPAVIKTKTKEMKEAAQRLEFERAALLRDEVAALRRFLKA